MKYILFCLLFLSSCGGTATSPQSSKNNNSIDSLYTGWRAKATFRYITDPKTGSDSAVATPNMSTSQTASMKIVQWDTAIFKAVLTITDSFGQNTTEEINTGKNTVGRYTGNGDIYFFGSDTIVYLDDQQTEAKVWK